MEYLSYQPDQPPPPCLKPETAQLSDPDTVRLVVAPDSERPEPNCPLRIAEKTPTGDCYQGQVLGWRWEGLGSLTLPSGVRYEGQFRDGRFHGTGTLHFPTGSKYQGRWDQGVCTDGLFTFADGLSFSDQDWSYCQYPDRRFWSEIRNGIRPAGRSQLTDRDDHPGVNIPVGMFDAGDGVYDPKCRTVYDYGDTRKIKRVVTDDDHQWIMSRCRRGGDTFMGRREELHQDLVPLVFQGGHCRKPPPLPEGELTLEDLLREPEQPAEPAQPTPPPLGDSREQSADLVREVLRSAQRVATTVRSIVSGAASKVASAQEDALQIVRETEERAGSTSSTVSSLMEEARRRLGSLSSSSGSSSGSGSGSVTVSDWSSAGSGEELSVAPEGGRSRRTAHAAITDSSSGESVAGSRAGSGGGRAGGRGGSADGAGSGGSRVESGQGSRAGSGQGSRAGSGGFGGRTVGGGSGGDD